MSGSGGIAQGKTPNPSEHKTLGSTALYLKYGLDWKRMA